MNIKLIAFEHAGFRSATPARCLNARQTQFVLSQWTTVSLQPEIYIFQSEIIVITNQY